MKIEISAGCADVFVDSESKQLIRHLNHMFDNYHKKLKLIWMIISIAVLLQLGWLLIELHFTKQSLAETYQNIVGIKPERIQN